MTTREIKLSELRAKWAIKQQQAAQLAAAIWVLDDKNMMDDVIALKVADDICQANIGP